MKTGTTCTRCANASICPAYDARMLYGFCQGFVESDDHVKDVAILNDDAALVEDLGSKGSTVTESEAVDSLVWPQLLILDEVGVQFGSDAEKILLFDVLNERYEKRKSTIIISNLTVLEVKEYLGERIFDRMREDGGKSIAFDWKSHRVKV